ncbi:hypothetical protein [Streptomyces sp. MST-110588]|uniref:SCO4225 family membrane protein n=1 Tax=Streptomyces sp. MST-110588 TaxID=2833628 RepID=UPI001F5DF298|nr:hypothetical protein [Streptomyces sp. MST-110588]UNO38904.1 hypothetical protein KGS77_03680 [Streptomyces sp. MST-110588]
MHTTHRLHALMRLTFGNPVSLAYLGLVAAALAFAAVDTLFVSHQDASFSGIWAALLTAPTVFPLWLAGGALWGGSGAPGWYLTVTLILAALVNALLLGLARRAVRSRTSARSAAAGGDVSGGWHTRRHGDL